MEFPLETKLYNQVVVITGASGGIGATLAHAFLQSGARVALLARRRDRLQEFLNKYQSDRCIALPTDVKSYRQVSKSINSIIKSWKRIHILVNNAGVYPPETPMWELSPQCWKETINTNLNGIFNLCRCVVPIMIKNNYGRIINVSSEMTDTPNSLAYSITKNAADNLSLILSRELAPMKVDVLVNSIDPGSVFSEMNLEGPYATEKTIPLFLKLATLPEGSQHGIKWSNKFTL